MTQTRSPSARPLSAIVLAAGAGTRMKSSLPKSLHRICGRPMVVHVLAALEPVSVDHVVVVVGHGSEQVIEAVRSTQPDARRLHFVEQRVQRGTGDAVATALPALPDFVGDVADDEDDADVIVMPCDMPLLETSNIALLVDQHRYSDSAATILTVDVEDPTGYGRIVRDKHDRIARIIEERDATSEQREIREVNTSVYCFRLSLLQAALRKIDAQNDQGELLLTDVIDVLSTAGHRVSSVMINDATWAVGVNDRAQLANAEAQLRRRINHEWMAQGVTLVDPLTTYIDQDVVLESDVTLLPNTRLVGACRIGSGAVIGPDVSLVDCEVGANGVVSYATGTAARVGEGATVGPFAILLRDAIVSDYVATGSFVTVGEQ